MSWEPGRRTAPPVKPAERQIVAFVKDARAVRLIERATPFGRRELVCTMAGELLWSRVLDGAAFDADVEAAIEAFTARGWTRAT